MNYPQVFQDTLRILRSTKLVWFVGLISILVRLLQPLAQLTKGNAFWACLYLPISLVIMYYSLIANGSLVFVVHQIALYREVNFAEVWQLGKTKMFRILGFILISVLPTLVAVLIYKVIEIKLPNSPLLWIIAFVLGSIISAFLTLGLCAIMVDDVKAASAASTSFLVAQDNLFHILVIYGVILVIRFLLTSLIGAILVFSVLRGELPVPLNFDLSTIQIILKIPGVALASWIIDLFLFIPTSVILTRGYTEFTKGKSYPALSNQ